MHIDHDLARRISRKQHHRTLDPEDVEQIALLAMVERGATFNSALGRFADYIDRWTRHECQHVTGCRRTGRKGSVHVDIEMWDAAAPSSDDGAAIALRQVLARLDPDDAAILTLGAQAVARERGWPLSTAYDGRAEAVARARALAES